MLGKIREVSTSILVLSIWITSTNIITEYLLGL